MFTHDLQRRIVELKRWQAVRLVEKRLPNLGQPSMLVQKSPRDGHVVASESARDSFGLALVVIHGVLRDVEHDKLDKATLSTSTTVDFGIDAIVVSMAIYAKTDSIVNAMEVDASSNATINDNVNGGGTDAIIDAAKDIEVVGTDAIVGDRKDIGDEDLIDREAGIGEAVLKNDVVAQDKVICQVGVVGLAVDVQAIHDGLNVDDVNVIVYATKVDPSIDTAIDGNVNDVGTDIIIDANNDSEFVDTDATFGDRKDIGKAICQTEIAGLVVDVQALHDGVLNDVELDKLEKATLSMYTTIGFGIDAIVDPMAVDAKTDGNVNAMKVDASIDADVDGIVNNVSNVNAMQVDASTYASVDGIVNEGNCVNGNVNVAGTTIIIDAGYPIVEAAEVVGIDATIGDMRGMVGEGVINTRAGTIETVGTRDVVGHVKTYCPSSVPSFVDKNDLSSSLVDVAAIVGANAIVEDILGCSDKKEHNAQLGGLVDNVKKGEGHRSRRFKPCLLLVRDATGVLYEKLPEGTANM
ncbi:hypothetical protein L7F22_042898 [Adiantum nelumboides]|nr:hypothetical protein [Adiantum nelumboides]